MSIRLSPLLAGVALSSLVAGCGGAGSDAAEPAPIRAPAPEPAATAAPEAKAPAKPQGRATLSVAEVNGGAVENAPSVVAQLEEEFQSCYEAALADDAQISRQGTVTMRLRVDPEGRVAAVRVEAEDATLATTVACAARQIKSQAQFAPPEGGRPIVSFDVRFERID